MRTRSHPLILICLLALAPQIAAAQALEPIVYTVKLSAPDTHFAEIEATYPTGGQASIELMMPIWTPGYYRVENYAGKVQSLTARTPDGKTLTVDQSKKNRWQIQTNGAARVVVSYKLLCPRGFVTSNYVGDDLLVLNGGAAFPTLVEKTRRPHDIHLELPAKWKHSMTALDAAPDGKPHHYRAPDFDTLVDSPMVAGNLDIQEFAVDGSKHVVVAAGDVAQWDGKRAAADLAKIVSENRRMWGFLPFKRYVFLCVLTGGGGGLEHKNSTLMFTGSGAMRTPGGYMSWLGLASHEYFHAFNVKRLRPIELGPFDYEKEPRTTGLWVAEGLTSYYGDIILPRSGLGGTTEFLARLSSHIDKVQKSPGRLVQSLEQASLDVWTSSTSGIGGAKDKTVSYYDKGLLVGFLLDAKIRRATNGAKSLDDLMKLAYQRYAGEKGFTAEQFHQTAEEVAGIDLKEWFKKAIASTEELDYSEALDWFGLEFAAGVEGKQVPKSWKLTQREDATDTQKSQLQIWLKQPAAKGLLLSLTPLLRHLNPLQGRRMGAEHPDVERRRRDIAEVVQRQPFFRLDERLGLVRQFQ
jgi:predicted metalloprotease with PDZ domain